MAVAPSAQRIYVVDDEESVRGVIARWLERDGHATEAFEAAQDALNRIRERRPTLVVSDIKMPGMDGLELLERVRAECGPHLPVFVFVTAHGDLDTARRALRNGAHEYLLKPFQLEDLGAVVHRGLERARLLCEREALLGLLVGRIRVPIGGVAAGLEALEEGLAGPLAPEQRELVSLARRECRELHRLVQNLDDIRLLERDQLYMRREPVDLVEAARAGWERAAATLAAAGVEATFDSTGAVSPVLGDAGLLVRAVENLLALAAGRQARRAELSVLAGTGGSHDGRLGEVVLRLRAGVAAAPRTPIAPGDEAAADADLELTFCRALATCWGGRLEVEERPGEGIVVALHLPASAGDPARAGDPDGPGAPRGR